MSALFSQEMLTLFAILAIGVWVGSLSLGSFSLGSAGVLFTALVFGHFGLTVPRPVMDLGLLLFVYSVGLQAGPRFFRTFRHHGMRFVVIALTASTGAALTTVLLQRWLRLPFDLAAGLYTGALTCTPALAAAIDAAQGLSPTSSGALSVGYGVAYPFSIIAVVMLIQFLPLLLRRKISAEETAWEADKQGETPALQTRQFRLINPNCDGKTVSEINPHRMIQANISRIKHGEQVFPAAPNHILHLGDVVMVVGPREELDKMRILLGEEACECMDVNADVLSVDVDVTEGSLAGKKLGELRMWEQCTVVITRIRRQGVEITPGGNISLEMGDNLRVVGDKAAVQRFVQLVHGHPHRAEETNMLPFLVGLLLGILAGSIPIILPNGLRFTLGSAGGAFLVSLIIGHFGRIGPLRLYVPAAAKNLSRELGLILFLAGAGVNAGAHFFEILGEQGLQLFFSGMLITISAIAAVLVVTHLIYRMNLLAIMGVLSASMTNPPGLGAANAQTSSDLPTLSYASVYPMALIFKILLAQILVETLARLP